MDYRNWTKKGELTDEALDWAIGFSDQYTGPIDGESVASALPPEMPKPVQGLVFDVVLGMAAGGAVMVQPEGERNQ